MDLGWRIGENSLAFYKTASMPFLTLTVTRNDSIPPQNGFTDQAHMEGFSEGPDLVQTSRQKVITGLFEEKTSNKLMNLTISSKLQVINGVLPTRLRGPGTLATRERHPWRWSN